MGILTIQHILDLVCAHLLELYDLFSSRNFWVCHHDSSEKLILFSKANEEVIYVSRDSFQTDCPEMQAKDLKAIVSESSVLTQILVKSGDTQ